MERVIVGYDNTPAARGALRWAVDYGSRVGAELVIVFVVPTIAEWELNAIQVNTDPIRREIEHHLNGDWTQSVRAAGVEHRIELEVGRPAESLLAVARRNDAAMIVIGMTPRGTLSELVFTSVGHHLAHHAVRPIVSVPADWAPPAATER